MLFLPSAAYAEDASQLTRNHTIASSAFEDCKLADLPLQNTTMALVLGRRFMYMNKLKITNSLTLPWFQPQMLATQCNCSLHG